MQTPTKVVFLESTNISFNFKVFYLRLVNLSNNATILLSPPFIPNIPKIPPILPLNSFSLSNPESTN